MLPHDSKARRLFVTSGGLKKIQEIKAEPGSILQEYINNINNRRRSLISEVSYVHNFDQSMSLSGGVQNTLSHNTNEYLLSDFKPVLTENNNYIYARLAKQFSKVFLSASTGAKMFWARNDQLHRHYIRNLSSVTAAWYISQKWAVQGMFTYTPTIPSLGAPVSYTHLTLPTKRT